MRDVPSLARALQPAMFRPLRHRDFRLYLAGTLVSAAGNWMQTVAEGWLAYRLTESAFALGLVTAAALLPAAILTLAGGALADRISKRKLLIAANGLAVLEPLLLAFLTFTGRIQVWHMVALSATLGTLAALGTGGRSAIIAEVVPEGELTNAVALYSLANWVFGRVGGSALAGWLILTLGETGCFLFNALSFVVLSLMLLVMRIAPGARPARDRGRGAVGEVVERLRRTPAAVGLLALIGLSSLFGMTVVFLLPVLVRQVLAGGPLEVGWLTAAYGVGAVLSAIGLANYASDDGGRRPLLIGRLFIPACLLALGLARWFPLTLVALLGLGASVASQNILVTAHLQRLAGEHLRGRVMSLYSMVVGGSLAAGSIGLGWLAERFGAPAALIGGAVVVAAGSALVVWRLPPALPGPTAPNQPPSP